MNYKIIYMAAVCVGGVGLIIPHGDTFRQTLIKLITILISLAIVDIGLFVHKNAVPSNNPRNIKWKMFLDTMSFVLMIGVITIAVVMFIVFTEGGY